ncbi:Fc.00g114230.m01.CDS01 [Cosmosporella sp. VM-42]
MVPFPLPPTNTINWTNPTEFAFTEASGHIESTYHSKTGKWSPFQFVADSHLRIHGLATGLNYGQQAFEGLKAFRMPGERGDIAIFRPEAHAGRFQHSSDLLGMPPVPTDLFVQACNAAVALNADYVPPHESGWSLYCRPLVFGSGRSLSPTLSAEYTFCVFIFPMPSASSVPVKAIILDDFDRAAPKGTGTAKAGGNYGGVLRWTSQAKTEGFGLTLHLDSVRHEYVDEFSLSGFLGVKGKPSSTNGTPNGTLNGTQNGRRGSSDVVLVVPDSPSALDSLTSDSIQHIARSWGWKVEKRPVPYTELPDFDEVIGTGTAVGLTAVRSICRREQKQNRLPAGPRVNFDGADDSEVIEYIPDGQQGGGPVFHQLLEYLRAIQLGKEYDRFEWLYKVHEQK